MAKKLNNASSKICKNEKQQFNSLIKVLKPKVYITDSSDFKRLVQELTGNGRIISAPPTMQLQTIEQGSSLDIGDRQECSIEVPADASMDSFDCYLNQVVLNDEINQTWNQIYEDITAFDSSVNQQMDLFAVRELESWLLDFDDQPYFF